MKTNHVRHDDPRGARSPVLPDINRSEVARQVGMSRAHMSKVLAGKARPSADTLIALAKLFGMDVEVLNRKLKEIADSSSSGSSKNSRSKIT